MHLHAPSRTAGPEPRDAPDRTSVARGPGSLRATLVGALTAAALVGGVAVGSAQAAPVRATAKIASIGADSTTPRITRFSTSVDPETGEWSSRVTFASRPTAENAGNLRVGLTSIGRPLAVAGWAARTDPATIAGPAPTDPDALPTSFNGTSLPTAGATAAFEGDGATLVLRSTGPLLVGVRPDVVSVSLSDRESDAEVQQGLAFLGPTAPASRLLARTARLQRTGRTVRVPLAAITRPASRRVTVSLHGRIVGGKLLPAKYSRRRVAIVTLSPSAMADFHRATTARLGLRTTLANGSVTTASRTTTITPKR